MKDFLILIITIAFVFITGLKMGAWYGHEKAIVDIQENRIAVPIPFTDMVAGSSASIYDHYILEGCLRKVQTLEAKQ